MSVTDQKPFTVTAEDMKHPWGGGFFCGMCGVDFKAGDTVRWVFTNDMQDAPGNPLVCQSCDGPDVRERWRAMWATWRDVRKRFRWFARER